MLASKSSKLMSEQLLTGRRAAIRSTRNVKTRECIHGEGAVRVLLSLEKSRRRFLTRLEDEGRRDWRGVHVVLRVSLLRVHQPSCVTSLGLGGARWRSWCSPLAPCLLTPPSVATGLTKGVIGRDVELPARRPCASSATHAAAAEQVRLVAIGRQWSPWCAAAPWPGTHP